MHSKYFFLGDVLDLLFGYVLWNGRLIAKWKQWSSENSLIQPAQLQRPAPSQISSATKFRDEEEIFLIFKDL